jgi:hypothetical protein
VRVRIPANVEHNISQFIALILTLLTYRRKTFALKLFIVQQID